MKKKGVGLVEEKQVVLLEEGRMDDGLTFSRSQVKVYCFLLQRKSHFPLQELLRSKKVRDIRSIFFVVLAETCVSTYNLQSSRGGLEVEQWSDNRTLCISVE